MKKLCLIGADGQLGTEISLALEKNKSIVCTPLTIKNLDLLDQAKVKTYFTENSFDFVINCAAYTAVDLAEEEGILNDAVNNLAVKNLAEVCDKQDIFLIHISTDFVFDGTKSSPMLETDQTNPLQAYGQAKLAGEQWVNNGIIIRTSWLYSPYGKNFVKTMINLGREREVLKVVDNQVGTPTYAFDLAKLILEICLTNNVQAKKGIYHFSNEGVASWYDFAQAVMEYAGIPCKVVPIPASAFPTPAKRPSYSVLDKSKVKKTFDLEIPYWRTSLQACIKILKEDESRN